MTAFAARPTFLWHGYGSERNVWALENGHCTLDMVRLDLGKGKVVEHFDYAIQVFRLLRNMNSKPPDVFDAFELRLNIYWKVMKALSNSVARTN